jgi:hypothetical protein
MTPLIFASAMALFRATLSSPDPLFPTDGTAGGPTPVNGVWAGLPADCAEPTSLDLSTWPKCATPVGFLDGVIAVLEKPGPGKRATPDQYYSIARTKFWVVKAAPASPATAQAAAASAPAEPPSLAAPAIVQVDIPILFASSTIYIAVTPDAVDDKGGFVAATGWPIGCPATPLAGVSVDGGHCSATTADGVRAAAAIEPDVSKTYRLVRINAALAAAAGPASAASPPAVTPPSTAVSPPANMPLSTPPTVAPGIVTEAPPGAPTPPT